MSSNFKNQPRHLFFRPTYYLSPVTSYLLLLTCYFLLVTCYLLLVTCYFSRPVLACQTLQCLPSSRSPRCSRRPCSSAPSSCRPRLPASARSAAQTPPTWASTPAAAPSACCSWQP